MTGNEAGWWPGNEAVGMRLGALGATCSYSYIQQSDDLVTSCVWFIIPFHDVI